MRGGCGAVVMSLVFFTGPAFAASDKAPPAAQGFQAALRIGYARPMGAFEAEGNLAISEAFREQVPITVDIGYRPYPSLYLGGFTSFASGGVGERFEDLCASGHCTPFGFRFGVNLIGYFRPDAGFNPWVGFGMGGEITSLSVGELGQDATSSVRAFDFAILSGGTDLRLSKMIGFGPYLQYAFGVYTHRRVSTPRYTLDAPIGETEPHGWLTAGFRLVLFP